MHFSETRQGKVGNTKTTIVFPYNAITIDTDEPIAPVQP